MRTHDDEGNNKVGIPMWRCWFEETVHASSIIDKAPHSITDLAQTSDSPQTVKGFHKDIVIRNDDSVISTEDVDDSREEKLGSANQIEEADDIGQEKGEEVK